MDTWNTTLKISVENGFIQNLTSGTELFSQEKKILNATAVLQATFLKALGK